jgi:uncharacterized membrane protein (UPF0127 family)
MIISINKNKFKVKVMILPRDTQKGMMGRKFDSTFNGMLFLMDGDEQCFWMKNCVIPLDIVMIDGNTITEIHHSCPPCTADECDNYCGEGDVVLELPSGTCKKLGFQIGDEVIF